MKFSFRTTASAGARIGVVSNIERLPDFVMETPNLLLYTQGGLVPHLTPDVVELLTPAPQAIMLPLPNIANLRDRIKSAPMDIASYIGMPQFLNILTVMDPGRPRLEGFHKTNILAVQTRSGKIEFDPDSYMDFIDNAKPDAFVALCDGDTRKESTKKRVEKSTSRSQIMLKQCMGRLQQTGANGRRGAVLVPLEGGTEPRSRSKYADDVSEHMKTDQVAGVIIDGLGQFGDEVTDRSVSDYENCIAASLEKCSMPGVRILPGAWDPTALFHLIELGIDIFDTSYPNLVTDRGAALVLPIHDLQPPNKRGKPPNFEISLKDPANAECFEPVMESCKCHCCKNHTRAYIHHLLNVREMLASVLLNIHNQQQYLELFAAIRHSLHKNTFQQLKESFTR